MASRFCAFCGLPYDPGNGHDYDLCVARIDGRLAKRRVEMADLKWSLAKAKEIQAQGWWRTLHSNPLEHEFKIMSKEPQMLTPEEASALIDCFWVQSMRCFGKVNRKAPLYLKLKRIAEGQ